MARTYSRQELYDLVWSKPITHVAKEFFLSDVAVHKICRKHAIPTPPLGWWAKKAAGKSVTQTVLSELPDGVSHTIIIPAAELRGETALVAAAREEARIRASDAQEDEAIESHDIVIQTLAALQTAIPAYNGLVVVNEPHLIHCEVAPISIERLGKILNAIVAAARKQGFLLEEGARSVQFAGRGETIGISITEVVQRIKHEPTPAELAKRDAWHKRRERRRRNPWDGEDDPFPWFPDWDYVCTGRLGFEMEGVYVTSGTGPRKTFRDAKIQRLEDMSSDIAVALAVLAVAKREAHERREAEERKRQDERRAREHPLRLKYVAERRSTALDQLLDDLAKVERLRRLTKGLAGLEASDTLPRFSEFLDWSQKELSRCEAALSCQGLEDRFADERIFGDDDDHCFRSQYYY